MKDLGDVGPPQLPVVGRPRKKHRLSTYPSATAMDGLAQEKVWKNRLKNKENFTKSILCQSKPSRTFHYFTIASLKLILVKQTAL